MRGCTRRKKSNTTWSILELGFCKFNVDGAARGKPGPAGIRGVVHNDRESMMLAFSEPTGIMESNEVELLAIKRAVHLRSRYGNDNLIIDGDSVNAIAWALGRKNTPWRLVNIARDIRKMN